MQNKTRTIFFILLLLILTASCKYFFGSNRTWSGFSPVIATALFSGFIINRKDQSFVLPLLTLLISDTIIQLLYSANLFPYAGFYKGQWINYLLILTATLVGWRVKGENKHSLIIGAILAPTIFFLLSNLRVWLNATEAVYPKSFNGLLSCYVVGLPYYKNALIATFVFLPVILFAYNYLTRDRLKLALS